MRNKIEIDILPTIEEMRETCKIVWGWRYKNWTDKQVKEYYTLYKQGFFDLK